MGAMSSHRSSRPPARGARRRRTAMAVALLLAPILILVACAPAARIVDSSAGLQPFALEELPREQRYIIAVPNFQVRAGSVSIGRVDLSGEGEQFFDELGSGVADIFVSEAFRSGQFRITERAELDKVLLEQDLAVSGRMRVLVVFCHPRRDSFTGAVADALIEGLSEAGHQTEFADLYREGFRRRANGNNLFMDG